MISVRIEDVLGCVETHPCSTVIEVAKLIDPELESKSHNDRINIINKVDRCLRRLTKQGYLESVNKKPTAWRVVGSDAKRDFPEVGVTLNGETKPICSWCKNLGVNYFTIKMRINRGWSVEKALTTPVRK